MGKTAQWIIDAREAKKLRKKKGKQTIAIIGKNTPNLRRKIRALTRSQSNQPAIKKHGRP